VGIDQSKTCDQRRRLIYDGLHRLYGRPPLWRRLESTLQLPLSVHLLTGPVVYALVDLRAPGDFSHRDIITLSTTDARVLPIWHYGQNHTADDWILWAMHPLHFGTLWGTSVKIL